MSYGTLKSPSPAGAGLERPPRRIVLSLLAAALAVVAGLAVGTAAILAPAPAAAVPFVVAIGAGCPFLAGWELRSAKAPRSRFEPGGERALRRLRSQLARLPETRHPLGL